MAFSSRRRTSGACIAALGAILASAALDGARAEPVDAVPLDRPGTRMIEATPAPSAPPEPMMTEARPDEPATPMLGAAPLRAPEPALARIRFEPEEVTLSQTALAHLKSFAGELKRHAGRVALKAYAGAVGDTSTTARRLSLKRVLAVREVLLEEGIEAERLQVRALAGVRDAGPLDRVDITRPGG